MRILLYRGDGVIEPWVREFASIMPQAETVAWKEGEVLAPCDYAVLWNPAPALLEQLSPQSQLKAVFLMGAGVDALLKLGDALPPVPIVRLGDAGMGVQMAEYVAHAVLRLIDQAGRKEGNGIRIDFPISRQDIAEMTGTTLHTVSRILSAWEAKGLVEGGRQKLLVRDAAGLATLAEGEG